LYPTSQAAGLVISLGSKLSLWDEGRYLGSREVKLVPVQAGLSIQF